jgi:hypothetical protein
VVIFDQLAVTGTITCTVPKDKFESISLQHGVWCELAEAMPVRTVRMSAPPARRSTHRFCA